MFNIFSNCFSIGTSKEYVMKSYLQNLMDSINSAQTIQKAAIQVLSSNLKRNQNLIYIVICFPWDFWWIHFLSTLCAFSNKNLNYVQYEVRNEWMKLYFTILFTMKKSESCLMTTSFPPWTCSTKLLFNGQLKL